MCEYSNLLKTEDRLKYDISFMIVRYIGKEEELETRIPGLSFHRYNQPTKPLSAIYEPSICLAVQGSKRVVLGEEVYIYDPYHILITSINLPTVAQVVKADEEKPYLAIMLKLDLKAISQMMVDSGQPLPK